MSESYEFKIFDDNMKRQFLLNQMLEQEVQLFSLMVSPLADTDPQYEEWKWSFEEIKKSLSRLMTVYEDLGGGYDLQEIKRVINNSQQ
jgi:predicted ATPase